MFFVQPLQRDATFLNSIFTQGKHLHCILLRLNQILLFPCLFVCLFVCLFSKKNRFKSIFHLEWILVLSLLSYIQIYCILEDNFREFWNSYRIRENENIVLHPGVPIFLYVQEFRKQIQFFDKYLNAIIPAKIVQGKRKTTARKPCTISSALLCLCVPSSKEFHLIKG